MNKQPLTSRKSVLVLAFAALALSFTGIAHAGPWGTGGSIGGGYKTIFNNQDLFCDLSDPLSTATMNATVAGGPNNAPTFRFGAVRDNNGNIVDPAYGATVCWEVPRNTADPREYCKDNSCTKGSFTLIQYRMDGGLEVTKTANRTTWVFRVEDGPRDENLLWRLKPADQATIDEFCKDQNGDPISAPEDNCRANFGLDEHKKATPDGGGDGEKKGDYPKTDVNGDGVIDLAKGQVFKFTTETIGGEEKPKYLFWGPCHNGQYDIRVRPACKVGKWPKTKKTRGKGQVKAIKKK